VSSANRNRRVQNRDARSAAAEEALRRAKRRRITLAVVGLGLALVVALALVTFASDDGDNAASSTTSTSAATTTTLPSAKGKPCVAAKGPYPKDTPEVPVEVGPPPKKLIIRDLVKGEGPAVEPGATVSMNYVLVACSTGKIVESSFETGEPLTIPLDQVIPGWSQGVPGMRPGGVRLLGVPPKFGYRDVGQGADIAPNETLWFVVKLVPPPDATTTTTTPAAASSTTTSIATTSTT
jgi:peptidylprolyl isomerase